MHLFPHLFKPLDLGYTQLKNRVIITSFAQAYKILEMA